LKPLKRKDKHYHYELWRQDKKPLNIELAKGVDKASNGRDIGTKPEYVSVTERRFH